MALSVRARFDVRSVRPRERATVHLAVAITAAADAAPLERERPPQSTVLALDVSGSMQGEPLAHVVRAVDVILDAMRPVDAVGVVAFADAATVVVSPAPLDAAHKRLVKSRTARLFAEGSTNVESGLDAAFAEVLPRSGPRGVVLLSDGVPNRGHCQPEALARVAKKHRPHVSVSALGFGVAHAEEVLVAVADGGGGGYAFVAEPGSCARAFAKAIGAQADVVATGIELVIAPREGVSVKGFVSSRETHRFDREGIVVALPDMTAGASRVVVAELTLDVPNGFLTDVVGITVRWRAGEHARESAESLALEIADRAPAVDEEGLAWVMLARTDRARDDARALADRGNFAGAATVLRRLLGALDGVPGFVNGDGSPLAEAYEVCLDEAMAYERRPSPEAYAAFRKGTYASRVASMPAPPSSRGPMSARLLVKNAGDYPAAHLVVAKGPSPGARHRLGDECVLGRSTQADLVLPSLMVSRRHAEVYAEGGAFFVVDMGSTSPTYVNDERIDAKGRRLVNGDRIVIGDIELVYEETR